MDLQIVRHVQKELIPILLPQQIVQIVQQDGLVMELIVLFLHVMDISQMTSLMFAVELDNVSQLIHVNVNLAMLVIIVDLLISVVYH